MQADYVYIATYAAQISIFVALGVSLDLVDVVCTFVRRVESGPNREQLSHLMCAV